MAPNAYEPCPCGSGKKFKWCCAPYFANIERALDLQQQGQHESAVRVMEQAVQEHAGFAPIWGYFAHLLYLEGNIERAEEVLQKAFELQPNFAFGFLLRGLFRQSEGEIIGALLLFRKAAEAYDPQSHVQLAQVYEMIARHEIILNRPIAARAALERAANFSPGDQELREQLELFFGEGTRLPRAAVKKYNFRATAKPLALDSLTGRFSEARAAYERMTQQVPDDPAAWFNLGLVRAWTGEQPAAVEALQKSIELEWDDAKAEETAALVEVLRLGQGMENDSDYIEHRIFFPLRDPQAVFQLIQTWANERRVLAPQSDPNGTHFSCLIVEHLPSLLDTGTTMARVVANLSLSGGVLRLWHGDADSVKKVASEIRDRVNLAVGEPVEGTGPAQFGDVAQDALIYPIQSSDFEQAQSKLRDRATHYFEDIWPNQPLRSLGGVTPLDAAGSKLLRKRLLGVIRFLQDCLESASPRRGKGEESEIIEVYDFQRLRHKLGAELQPAGPAPAIHVPEEPAAPPPQQIEAGAPNSQPTPARPAAPAGKRDYTAMSAADLAQLPLEELSAADLEDAMRAALKLDARELAVRFAQVGAGKPFDASKPDRYPLYACLMTAAIAEGDPATALSHAAAGAAYDAEHNQGKRANEFAVQRGKLLARKGEIADAVSVFEELLARNPDEGKYYITATETMLSARQPEHAVRFAEQALAKARSSGNRDLEGASMELLEAARRSGR